MKLVVLSLTIFFATLLEARFVVWPTGKEYTYDYYGHFLSTVDSFGERVVGIGQKATVSVYANAPQQITIKLQKFQTATLDKDVKDIDEDELPWEFQTIPGTLTSHVELPFRVELADGRVKSMLVSGEESHESINIKKGVLTMLQIDTSKIFAPTASPYSKPTRNPYGNILTPTEDDVDVVSYMEDGVIGECESTYIISSEPSPLNPNAQVLNITKIRNFNKCNQKPEWARASHVPNECSQCDAFEMHPYPTVLRLDYDLRRHGEELVIESIVSEAQTQFKPFTAKSDYLLANHSQILELVSVKPIVGSPPEPTRPVPMSNLRYVFPTASRALQSGPYTIKKPMVPFLNDKKYDPVADATTIFEKLLQLIQEEATKSRFESIATLEMYNCVRAIRLMTYDDIHSFYSKVGGNYKNRRESSFPDDRIQLFSQLLAMTGSAPSVLFIKYMLESETLAGEFAAQLIQSLPTNIYEIPYELLNEILSLARSRVVREKSQLYKTAWLSFGILMSRACDGPEDDVPTLPDAPHIKEYCPPDVERKFMQEIERELKSTDKIDEILMFLKVLGLTELSSAIPILAPYASGESSESESIQIAALRNLREIAKFSPEEVLEVAEPEFYDTDNPIPIRLAALRAILAAQPDYDDLQKIVTWADQEPSDDISGYIYSFFSSIANATHYCLVDQANDAEKLLEFLDEEDENGIQGSGVWESSQIFDDLGISTQTYVSWTKSNSSIIPETIIFRNNLTVAGYSVKPIQIQLHTKGIQTIIDRILGPKGGFRNIKTIEDIFRPEYEDEERRRSYINEQLKLDSREEDPFMFNGFFKFGDTQARMFYADYKSVSEYFRNYRFDFSQLRSGLPLHFHKLALMFELQYQMPSILGVPMILNIFNPSIFSIKGKLAVHLERSNQQIFPDSVKMELELKPSFQSHIGMRIGVYNPFDKAISVVGVSSTVYLNFPIAAEAEYNLLEEKFHFQIKPSTTLFQANTDKLYLAQYKVKTYSCQYSLKSMLENCQRPNLIHQDPQPDITEIDLSKKYLGLPLLFKSVSEHDWTDLGSFLSYFQEYDDVFSFISTIWTFPEFSPRYYYLLLDQQQASDKAIDVFFNWEYTPTPVERKVLESRHSYAGLWPVLTGFAKIPQRCGSKSADSNFESENNFWYIETDKQPSSASSRPTDEKEEEDDDDESHFNYDDYFANKMKKTIREYSENSPFVFKYMKKSDASSYKTPKLASDDKIKKVPFSTEEIQRKGEIASFKMDLKVVAKAPVSAQFLSTFVFKRDLNELQDVIALNFEFVNIPIFNPQRLQICSAGLIRYPEIPCDFHGRMNPTFAKPILGEFKLSWGQQCPQTAQLFAKVKLEKSEEQLESEREKADWYFQQCQEDLRRGMKLSDACELAQFQISSLNKFILEAEFSELPRWLLNLTHKLDTYLKVHNYVHMTNNPVGVRNPENRLRVVSFIYNDVSAYDLQIFKPRENTFFKKVPYDDDIPYLFPVTTETTLYKQFVDELTDGYSSPSCKSMGQYIETFDNSTYKFPMSDCQHVIAKDCSRDDLFSVSLSRFDKTQKVLRMFVLSHQIVVTPTKDSRYRGNFHVEIDNKIVHPSDDVVVALKTQDKDAPNAIVALLVKTGPELYIQLPFTGVIVKFDGEDAMVIVSQFWRGKVCGLCGEFREETFEDLIGPQQCLYPDPISFGISYGLQDYNCKLPTPPNSNKVCDNDYYYDVKPNYSQKSYTPATKSMRRSSQMSDYDSY